MSKTVRSIRMDSELSKSLDKICVRHGDVTYHVEQALASYAPIKKLLSPTKTKKTAAKQDDTELQALCKAAWKAYSDAYYNRYQTQPTRNAKVNSSVKSFCQRIGKDAPYVASFYVGINDQWLIKCFHDVGNLLVKCETFHTQWKTGQTMTHTQARQADQTQANVSAVEQAKLILSKRNE